MELQHLENEQEVAGAIDEQAKDLTNIRDTGGKALKPPNIEDFSPNDPNANTQVLNLEGPGFDLETINEESKLDEISLAKIDEISMLNDSDDDFMNFK